MSVDRFNLWDEPGEPAEMEWDEAGSYVRFSDYEKLRSDLKAAQEAIKKAPTENDGSGCPTRAALDWRNLPAVRAAFEGER